MANGAYINDPSTWGPDALAIDPWYGDVVDTETINDSYWFRRTPTTVLVDGTQNHDRNAPRFEAAESEIDLEAAVEDCFVATAAMGTPLAAELEPLRAYRDRVLRRRDAGRAFVAWYARWGPILAAWLNDHAQWKPAVRATIVRPAARAARAALRS
jgi:hypothetical protein